MKKDKVIHLRVSDTFYEELHDLAYSCDDSVSNLIREMIKLGIKGWDDYFMDSYPLHNAKFISLLLWIYSQRESINNLDNNTSLELIRFHKRTLDEKIELLDPYIRSLFLNVKSDLERILRESNENTNIITRFGSKGNENYFDYDLFDKFLMHKSM